MLGKPHIRRPVAGVLMIVGAAMIFLAPATWVGVLVLALGVSVEVAGIAFKRKE